jgi:hypothetical protein
VLGIRGSGPGAFGYYRSGEKRWRLLSLVGRDADQAKDVLRSVGALPGATEQKGLGDGAARVVVQDPPGAHQSEWLLARAGATIVGIGDEATALRAGMSAEERDARTLGLADKRRRLEAWLERRRPSR